MTCKILIFYKKFYQFYSKFFIFITIYYYKSEIISLLLNINENNYYKIKRK